MNVNQYNFPFSAIVGQEDLKLALTLAVIDPLLGGVLVIGDKGTAKTTLIRSLTSMMACNQDFPFVNLPIGATEDRVLGHINLEKLINDKKEIVQLGLLAKANQGCLYIDEINLLNDYLMDILLDAAATGSYQLERDGLSKSIKSRFCLIGSMNPEEGDLRPQLKDRFGLSVFVKTSNSLPERVQIIIHRLQYDDNPALFVENFETQEQQVYNQIKTAQQNLINTTINPSLYQDAATIAMQNKVEGHRADVLLLKAARAYAAFLGDAKVEVFHVEKVTPFVLNHRSNNDNFSKNKEDQNNQQEPENQPQETINPPQEAVFESVLPKNSLPNFKDSPLNRHNNDYLATDFSTNKYKESPSLNAKIDLNKTVRQYVTTNKFELKQKSLQVNKQHHLIFVLDSSGSMIKNKIVGYAKGFIEKFVKSNCDAAPLFSLLTLYNNEAQLELEAVANKTIFLERLSEIKTGGKTNIIPAFKIIKRMTHNIKDFHYELIIVTDGKFNTTADNAQDEAVVACKTYCKSVAKTTIIDAENGLVKLHLAQKYANQIKAHYEKLLV